MIYFVHGPDRLLARQAALAIAGEVDPDGSNTSWFDGRETPLERIINAAGTVSFFAAPRVIIVSDLLSRATRDAAAGDAEPAADDRQNATKTPIAPLLSSVPDDCYLILFEPSLATPPAAIRSATPPVTIVAGEPPRGAALVAWLVDAAVRSGSSIDRRAAQLLAETLFPQTWDRKPNNPRFDRPPDLALLSQEVEKLALAAHPDAINTEHILEHVAGGPNHRVFRFLDAAMSGDLTSAVGELERLATAGEEPAMLLAQILGQVELTIVADAAGGKDAAAVARDLGTVTPARMSAVMASSRRQATRAGAAVAGGVATDRKLKTGRIRQPGDALHDLVLNLATRTSQ